LRSNRTKAVRTDTKTPKTEMPTNPPINGSHFGMGAYFDARSLASPQSPMVGAPDTTRTYHTFAPMYGCFARSIPAIWSQWMLSHTLIAPIAEALTPSVIKGGRTAKASISTLGADIGISTGSIFGSAVYAPALNYAFRVSPDRSACVPCPE
jgi:hypothetical protein